MKTLFLLVAIGLGLVSCGRLFIRGRPNTRSGMLMDPPHQVEIFAAGANATEYWFDQKLNHFDPSDTRTWKQRYYVNSTLHKSGGPVFLQLGGEGEANPVWLQFGQTAINYAKRYNALNVLLEHRYYGKSHPTADLSTENLKYLTSEQALQDAATFIEFLNRNMSLAQSKWVVFGGSYSGALAAWFREKYPHLVVGAVASSAPVEAVVNFQDYLGVVSQSLGQKCDEAIKEATEQLGQELSQPSSWPNLTKQFKLCTAFNGTDSRDTSNLVMGLTGHIMGIVQYNKIVANRMSIDTVCSLMSDTSITALERYAKVNEQYMKANNESCLGYSYKSDILEMQQDKWTSPVANGVRQWVYQTCVEFGYYQSSDLKTQPFGSYFPVDFYVKQCADIFGAQYSSQYVTNAVDFTNNFYGGRNFRGSKVVFPNGSIDPWHALGILTDIGNNNTAVFIEGVAHCADMYGDQTGDLQGLKQARSDIENTIGQFLA